MRCIFLFSVPLMNPRTECACQLVASMIALSVAPSGCFISARIASVLLPSLAPFFVAALGAFFAWAALFFAGGSSGAASGLCGATAVAGPGSVASGMTASG